MLVWNDKSTASLIGAPDRFFRLLDDGSQFLRKWPRRRQVAFVEGLPRGLLRKVLVELVELSHGLLVATGGVGLLDAIGERLQRTDAMLDSGGAAHQFVLRLIQSARYATIPGVGSLEDGVFPSTLEGKLG